VGSKKNIPIYLELEEIHKMLDTEKTNFRNWLLVYLAYKTGLRCHELSSLKVEHIDFKNKLITVISGKGEKDRQVYMDDDLIQKLRFYIQDRKQGIVFQSNKRHKSSRKVKRTVYIYDENGKKIDSTTKFIELAPDQLNDTQVQKIVRDMVKNAGIIKAKPVTVHTLRHTFACHALLNDIPITTVQLALGHSSLRTTEIYLKAIQTTKQLQQDFERHPMPSIDLRLKL
jgi:site-specific recombinase XerD